MADATFNTKLLALLRSWKGFYTVLRSVRRGFWYALVELGRYFGSSVRFGAPAGFYEGLNQVRNGERQGGIILETQELPALPTPSLIERTGHNQNARQPWPIFWMKEAGVRLVGTSLAPLSSDKKLMREAVYGEEFCDTDPSYNYLFLPKAVSLPGSWTSIISLWSSGYYHWFMDALPRLALLADMPPETGVLVRGPLLRYQRESLQILGIEHRVRETSETHLLIEKYFFSSPVGMTGCTNPYSVKWLREKFLVHRAAIETPKRFFILRKGKTRGIRNEEEVSDYFCSQGWTLIDLETLALSEQISLFQNAEAIAGEHGAGFSNLLWCRPGCRVLELCADNFLNGCYEGIAVSLRLQHNFIVFPTDGTSKITIDISKISSYVK